MRTRWRILCAAILLIGAAGESMGLDRNVPDPYTSIDAAIADAVAGVDRVVITSGGLYSRFTLNKAVPVLKSTSDVVTIQSAPFASAAVVDDPGASVTGLTLVGVNNSLDVVRVKRGLVTGCTVKDNGYIINALAVVCLEAGGQITQSSIEMTSGYPNAVFVFSSTAANPVVITDNTVTISNRSNFTPPPGHVVCVSGNDSRVERNTITISGYTGLDIGVDLGGVNGGHQVLDNTITGASHGIRVDRNVGSSGTITVRGNIMVDCLTSGVDVEDAWNDLFERNTVTLSFVDGCGAPTVTGMLVGVMGITTDNNTIRQNLFVNVEVGIECYDQNSYAYNAYWNPSCSDPSDGSSLLEARRLTSVR